MLFIYPPTKQSSTTNLTNGTNTYIEQSNDYPFMKKCEEILNNFPDTWKAYPDDEIGACKILDMEYQEYKKATTKEDKSHELVHIASACLNMWRKYNVK